MFNDIDDDDFESKYDLGVWEWDEIEHKLKFTSELPDEDYADNKLEYKIIGPVDFKDDLDLIEQVRFRKRYQRAGKGDNDVVTVQDIKDVVLYTAPLVLLSESLIGMLHLPAADRLLRALILYTQYFLQIQDEMTRRRIELFYKVRTPNSETIERAYQDNLEDLRLLVTKEYASIILGSGEFSTVHHMGPSRRGRSKFKRDAQVYESLLRVSVQVVWLALGRKSFNQIEIEINRIFKSEKFNSAEHRLQTDYESNMSPQERRVLLGHCLRHDNKLLTRSPLINELKCSKEMDFRMLAFGVLNLPNLSSNPRLKYFETILIAPERSLHDHGLTLGIVGMKRNLFDTMLREFAANQSGTSSSSPFRSSRSKSVGSGSKSIGSRKSMGKGISITVYGDIVLPEKMPLERLPEEFPTKKFREPHNRELNIQKRKWLRRIHDARRKRHN